MAEMHDKEFDELFRSAFEDATEEVPSHVWTSVEKRLPKRQGRVIPLMLKVLVPVAAAVILAVLLFPDTVGQQQTPSQISVIPTASYTAYIPAGEIPSPRPLDAVRVKTTAYETVTVADANSSEVAGVLSADANSSEVAGVPVADANSSEVAGVLSADAGAEDVSTGDQWEAFLASEDAEDERDIRFAFTLSGNAVSNTGSSADSGPGTGIAALRPNRTMGLKDRVVESSESSYGIPLSFGLGAKVYFTERWALGFGLNYTGLTRTFDGIWYRVVENQYRTAVISNIRNRQDYLGIPVNAYFNILRGDFVNFYTYAGGTVEKCLSDRYFMDIDDERAVHSEKVKGLQCSANIGLGLEFVIADQFGIYIDPSLRYYFESKNQPKSIRTIQPLMFGLELGFRVNL